MMISTVLLVVNFIFLFFKDAALFSFKHFFWIYPLEIGVYIFVVLFFVLASKQIVKRL